MKLIKWFVSLFSAKEKRERLKKQKELEQRLAEEAANIAKTYPTDIPNPLK